MDFFPLYVLALTLGLCFGSFFNALVWRLYTIETLGGRSRCPECRHTLGWRDLVPIFSYCFLGGCCRYCSKPISLQYPLIELASGIVFMLLMKHATDIYGPALFTGLFLAKTLFLFFVASVLLIVIASDAKFQLIYDIVIIPAIAIAVVWQLVIRANLLSLFLGVVVGLIFFGLQYVLSDGRWIGFGDVKLAVFLGVVFGWNAMLFLIALAYIVGSIVSIVLLIRRTSTMKSTIPLGVFLGGAGLYILCFGVRGLERVLHL